MIDEKYKTLDELGFCGDLLPLIPFEPKWVSYRVLLQDTHLKRANLSQRLRYYRLKKQIKSIKKGRQRYYQRIDHDERQ